MTVRSCYAWRVVRNNHTLFISHSALLCNIMHLLLCTLDDFCRPSMHSIWIQSLAPVLEPYNSLQSTVSLRGERVRADGRGRGIFVIISYKNNYLTALSSNQSSSSSCRFSNSTASLTIRTRFLGMFERFVAFGIVFRLTGPSHCIALIWAINSVHFMSPTTVSSQCASNPGWGS